MVVEEGGGGGREKGEREREREREKRERERERDPIQYMYTTYHHLIVWSCDVTVN